MNNLICMKSKQMQNLILILIKFYQRFGYIYIYIYFYMYVCILPRFIYFRLSVFYIELTHLAQKLKKKRLDETRGVKLNSN